MYSILKMILIAGISFVGIGAVIYIFISILLKAQIIIRVSATIKEIINRDNKTFVKLAFTNKQNLSFSVEKEYNLVDKSIIQIGDVRSIYIASDLEDMDKANSIFFEDELQVVWKMLIFFGMFITAISTILAFINSN